jgi:predicted DCC family thiol-disulfide oxidoreductase YuxK
MSASRLFHKRRFSRRGARELSPGSRGLTRRRAERVIPCKSIACHTLLPPVHKETAVALGVVGGLQPDKLSCSLKGDLDGICQGSHRQRLRLQCRRPPLLRWPSRGCLLFSMEAEQSIVVDPKSPGGINSPHGLILFDGVCVLCSRGCRFVSKRDRRGYFRFAPIQLAEGRPLAEQLGIDPDRPDSFAFVANGQAYVKSEAALRIARELPRWQWTWVLHFIPQVIRNAIYDLVARNRYHWFGRRDACILPNSDRS